MLRCLQQWCSWSGSSRTRSWTFWDQCCPLRWPAALLKVCQQAPPMLWLLALLRSGGTGVLACMGAAQCKRLASATAVGPSDMVKSRLQATRIPALFVKCNMSVCVCRRAGPQHPPALQHCSHLCRLQQAPSTPGSTACSAAALSRPCRCRPALQQQPACSSARQAPGRPQQAACRPQRGCC